MKFFSSLFSSIPSRITSLSSKEKTVFVLLVLVAICGTVGFINHLNSRLSVLIPVHGGTLREGVLGTPRFINPVLASSDIDEDLTRLVYSGLMRRLPDDTNTSNVTPDLAESYTVSSDGKIYTFVLKENAVFHDRKPVTAADVVFTIKMIQDSRFQSPLAENWLGVTAEAVDATTVVITLPRAYSGFLNMATVGILPQHIWGTLNTDEFLASNYNTVPVGSGPYKIGSIGRDNNGIADTYTFTSFNKFTLGKPYIKKIVISLYPNEQDLLRAYEQRDFDILANAHPYEINPDNTQYSVTASLPRMFGLFLNSEKNDIFKDAGLRNVINQAINADEITQSVFQGYAQPISYPVPELAQVSEPQKLSSDIIAKKLDDLGWKLNESTGLRQKNGKSLSFTISTADTAELKYTAQIIQKQLRDVGVTAELQIFQLNDLENSVIKKRSFDALLFGQLIRSDADLYAFWHSSQKGPDGLNITGYSTSMLDTSLEKLLTASEPDERSRLLTDIQRQLDSAPVVWLYQPDFIYALHTPVYGIILDNLISKHDRFNTVATWYLNTDTVWKLFKK